MQLQAGEQNLNESCPGVLQGLPSARLPSTHQAGSGIAGLYGLYCEAANYMLNFWGVYVLGWRGVTCDSETLLHAI